MHLLDDRLGEEAARHARLIGHHDHADAGAVERPDRTAAPGVQLHALRPIEVADLLDDRAVAIDKGRRVHGCDRAAAMTAPTEMPRMHPWVSGHSRSMHGRHQTSCVRTSCRPRPSGWVARSSVGPNMAIT